ncbi:hypothetical protein HYS90_01625 [Candidatus Curtissbacteria bacterium]|nr:hypothetical protein [Candidatus Curtissbacteria bacterium]MBI2599158.1 hypothetical protein [Candidatus Curtissbacteria bacterium]
MARPDAEPLGIPVRAAGVLGSAVVATGIETGLAQAVIESQAAVGITAILLLAVFTATAIDVATRPR